jgi:hypothetical protein
VTDPGTARHIEVKDGDETVADADVTTSPEPEGTTRASLRAASGHIALDRLRERADDVTTRPAGASALVEAKVRSADDSGADQ